jgi:hypothetical protein
LGVFPVFSRFRLFRACDAGQPCFLWQERLFLCPASSSRTEFFAGAGGSVSTHGGAAAALFSLAMLGWPRRI